MELSKLLVTIRESMEDGNSIDKEFYEECWEKVFEILNVQYNPRHGIDIIDFDDVKFWNEIINSEVDIWN